MYGLVNKALSGVIVDHYGQAHWDLICQQAGVAQVDFIPLEQYPDSLTYTLVKTASAVLGLSPSALLEEFGEYWVLTTAEENYGDLLDFAGKTLPDLLQNLDALHARIARSYPGLRPPSFSCTEEVRGTILLHYHSERDGLAPLVIGILKGLGKRFATPMTISQVAAKAAGADHDVFEVVYEQPD